MSITKYRAFLSIAKTCSFTATAKEIHCTQSAASRMILDLEEQWGTELFIRQKNRCTLTSEGQLLLPYVRAIVDAEKNLQTAVSSVTGLATGTVRIGTFASVATFWLPKVIHKFEKLYPGIRYEVLMGDFQEIEDWTRKGEVDFGFTTESIGSGVKATKIAQDEFLLAMPVNHRLSVKKQIRVRDLDNERFLLLEKGRQGIVSDLFVRENVHPNILLKTFEDHAILNMVKMGIGVGILPSLILQPRPQDVLLRSLTPATYRSIYLLTRDDGTVSLAAKQFLKCFRDTLCDELLENDGLETLCR